MDLAGVTARLYAADMMDFVMREHEVCWKNTIETANVSAKDVEVRFHPAVGKVMVNSVKGMWKRKLEGISPVVMDCVKSDEDFLKCGRMYARNLFERVGFNPFTVLQAFAFMAEFLVRYYKERVILADAPETAMKFITGILESPEGLSVLNSRLNALNEAAKNMLPKVRRRWGISSNPGSSILQT